MKKPRNKKNIFLFICLFILFGITLYYSVNDGVNISFSNLKDFLYKPFKDFNNNKRDLIGKNLNTEIMDENNELKDIAKIDKTLSSFKTINATVIERNHAYWLNSITINKGKKDGVDIGYAVVVSEGLIGKITKITNNTAVVKLITSMDTNNKISVKIKYEDSYIYKVLENDMDNLVVKGIDNNTSIDMDTPVVTSGLSDIYPSGIVIGRVTDLKSDKYGTSKTAFITSDVNFDNLRFVSVLIRS